MGILHMTWWDMFVCPLWFILGACLGYLKRVSVTLSPRQMEEEKKQALVREVSFPSDYKRSCKGSRVIQRIWNWTIFLSGRWATCVTGCWQVWNWQGQYLELLLVLALLSISVKADTEQIDFLVGDRRCSFPRLRNVKGSLDCCDRSRLD